MNAPPKSKEEFQKDCLAMVNQIDAVMGDNLEFNMGLNALGIAIARHLCICGADCTRSLAALETIVRGNYKAMARECELTTPPPKP